MAAVRPTHRRSVTKRRVAGAGIAGVAAALGVAPLAYAAPSPTPTPTPSATKPSAAPGQAKARVQPAVDGTTTVTTTTAPAPDYGNQKIRIGVQEKDGSYPAGVDTSGSEVTIVETGDGVDGTKTSTCLTDASTRETGSTATYCLFPDNLDLDRRAVAADAPDPNNYQDLANFYIARDGDTVVITQTALGPKAEKVLLNDTTAKTYAPCEAAPPYGSCADTPDALFTDPGIPPKAVDDAVTTPQNTTVDIAVLSNDDTVVGAPVTELEVTKDPSHGTVVSEPLTTGAVRRAAAGPFGPPFLYTPTTGFSGVDHFTYRLTDANGSATAVVTITVTAPTAPSSSPSSTAPLAVTGTQDLDLLALGALLLAGGGAATVAGRRVRRGRHTA